MIKQKGMKKLKTLIIYFSVIKVSLLYTNNLYSSEEIWKCGTIAPQGSEYEKVIKKISQELNKIINVQIKVFYATHFRDEIDIVEDMKSGKLDCGILTGNGLGYLSIYARVLELPFLIKSKAEWEKSRTKLLNILGKSMKEEGWEILGLFGIGFVHFLSKYPLEKIQDFSGKAFWVWPTNPIQVESFNILKMFGTKSVEVSPLDLITFCDKIDIIWGPTYTFVAFGWYRYFKYIMFPSILYFPGGVVVSSEKIKKYSPEQILKIRELFERESNNITQEFEKINDKAYEVLFKSGIKKVDIKDIDKIENVFKSQMYENFKKYIPSWLIVSIIEEILKVRDIK